MRTHFLWVHDSNSNKKSLLKFKLSLWANFPTTAGSTEASFGVVGNMLTHCYLNKYTNEEDEYKVPASG